MQRYWTKRAQRHLGMRHGHAPQPRSFQATPVPERYISQQLHIHASYVCSSSYSTRFVMQTQAGTDSQRRSSNHDSPRQPQEHPAELPVASVEEEARVGAVVYDMFMRGGDDAETMAGPFLETYPLATSLARYCALYSTQLIAPSLMQSVQHQREFVLRRISILPFAWFCSFLGSTLATIRLWVIFSLAILITAARLSENEAMANFVSIMADQLLDRGPRKELYHWILNLINEENPLVTIGSNGATAGRSVHVMPDHLATFFLLTPFISGIIFFALGYAAGVVVNFGLRWAGGLRLHNRYH